MIFEYIVLNCLMAHITACLIAETYKGLRGRTDKNAQPKIYTETTVFKLIY